MSQHEAEFKIPAPNLEGISRYPRAMRFALRTFSGANPAVWKFLCDLVQRVDQLEERVGDMDKILDASRKPTKFGR